MKIIAWPYIIFVKKIKKHRVEKKKRHWAKKDAQRKSLAGDLLHPEYGV